jgi:AcrR family transcriptional regulator
MPLGRMMATTGSSDTTRDRLIRAAERLMAEHGIEAVDLRDIQAAAGQRNRSAVNYYFKDRDGLVRAIIDKHRVALNEQRHHLLDAWERAAHPSIHSLLLAGVAPYIDRLDDPSIRDFMIIVAERAARLGSAGVFIARQPHTDSVRRLNGMLAALLAGPRAARERQVGMAVLTLSTLLADVARQINRNEITVTAGRRRIGDMTEFVARALTPADHGPAARFLQAGGSERPPAGRRRRRRERPSSP